MIFEKINLEDKNAIELTSKVATEIVKEHYDPILGPAQNDYMLDKFQSIRAITEQIKKGYQYFLVKDKNDIIGFIAFYDRSKDLYLSKLYLYKNHRGKGYSRQILNFILDIAKKHGLNAIELNVNKYNDAVFIYEKLGFIRIRAEKNDIGCGYYMDDYVYRLEF